MMTIIKEIKTQDDVKTFSLSKDDSVRYKSNSLIYSILEALQLSYNNNQNDLPIDYAGTIKLLYQKMIQLKSFDLTKATQIERFKLAEAANDLAMAFNRSFQFNGNKKDLKRAEDFYLFSFKICPITIGYFNYFSLLKENNKTYRIKSLYKDMLEAEFYKVSQAEIREIFFKQWK